MDDFVKILNANPPLIFLLSVVGLFAAAILLFFVYVVFEKVCEVAVKLVHGHPPAPVCSCDTDDDEEEGGGEQDDNPHATKGFAKP